MAELYINLKVIARARVNKIGETFISSEGKSVLKIYVTSPAEHGKANKAIIELLAKHLKVAKSDIRILQGQHNNNKLVLIYNYN
ncbi:MAG: DUF167 domain-containing protein [Rickettsiales endosymbiont of Dermacentor nuttalli]